MAHDSKNDKEDGRSLVAGLNEQALGRVLRDHPSIVIRADVLREWRPLKRTTGTIPGLEEAVGVVSALCSNGVVAWFRTKSGETFLGHVTEYEWTDEGGKSGKGCPPQPYSFSQPKATDPAKQGRNVGGAAKEKSPRRSAVQRALDLLLGKAR